jgi:urease accessory protein
MACQALSFMNLSLLQLGDSAIPIGGYCHSWGLEAAIDQGFVRDASGLEKWARSWLHFGLGPCEGVVVAAVCRGVARGEWHLACHANDILWAGLTPPTLRNASRDMGEQLLALSEAWPWAEATASAFRRLSETRGWHHAVVFAALAAAICGPDNALLVYLHQAALGVIGAGVRAIPIGHTHGQQILARLHPDIEGLSQELVQRELAMAGSFSPAYEVLCYAQSHLYTRLFRS